jgi:hypothetical protein
LLDSVKHSLTVGGSSGGGEGLGAGRGVLVHPESDRCGKIDDLHQHQPQQMSQSSSSALAVNVTSALSTILPPNDSCCNHGRNGAEIFEKRGNLFQVSFLWACI